MKTSTVLASLLFGAAMAAPVDRRAIKTELVIVTETIYTTLWPGQQAEPTKAPAAFYEKPNPKPVKPEVTSTTPAYTPPVVSTPTPTPTPAQEEKKPEQPAPVVEAPSTSAAPEPTKPAETPVQEQPQQQQQQQQEQPQQETKQETTQSSGSTSSPSGTEYSGKMSFHTFDGALGSCGKPIANTDFAVAMDARTFGASTYDTMTGEANNPWCGKTITIVNGAKSVQAKVMDLCAGCKSAQGLDLSFAVWDALVDSRDAGVVDMKWYA